MTCVLRWRAVGPTDEALLTPTELARRDRLLDPRDRAAYAAAHVLVRECAAELIGVDSADLVVTQRCADCGRAGHGRPELQGRPDVGISLSHTRDHVAAIAAFGACGIDVEGPLVGPIPRQALSAHDQSRVRRAADPAAEFVTRWTRREALVKAGAGRLDAPDLDERRWRVESCRGKSVVVSWAVERLVSENTTPKESP